MENFLITYQFTSRTGTVTNHNAIINEHPAKFIYNCNKNDEGKHVLLFAMPISAEIFVKYYDEIN